MREVASMEIRKTVLPQPLLPALFELCPCAGEAGESRNRNYIVAVGIFSPSVKAHRKHLNKNRLPAARGRYSREVFEAGTGSE